MAHNKHHSSSKAEHGRDDASHSGRDTASDVIRRTSASVEANPLGMLVGGLAVGVLAGALLPRSTREKELLAPVGRQIGARARTALEAARTAGMDELSNRGLTKDGVRDQARGLFDGVVKALSNAGTAAVQSAKHVS